MSLYWDIGTGRALCQGKDRTTSKRRSAKKQRRKKNLIREDIRAEAVQQRPGIDAITHPVEKGSVRRKIANLHQMDELVPPWWG